MECLCLFDDSSMNRMSVAICSILAAKVYQGPVVQSIVRLTTSLRHQFVKYMPTTLSNPLLFFPTTKKQQQWTCNICVLNFKETLVSFEQLVPDYKNLS